MLLFALDPLCSRANSFALRWATTAVDYQPGGRELHAGLWGGWCVFFLLMDRKKSAWL